MNVSPVSVRLLRRWTKQLVPSYRQSTLAKSGRIAAQGVGYRSHPAVQFMGTWTDKLKRWQSGSKQETVDEVKEGSNDSKQSTESSDEEKTPKEEQNVRSVNELEALLQEREEQIKQQSETVAKTQDKYKRALAETENVRQRMTKQVKEAKLYGIQGFSQDLLDVADILEKATESVPKEELEEHVNPPLSALYDGLKLTQAELQKVFSKNGLEKIDGVGENFDPNFHEALFELPGEKHGTVAVVSRVGYTLHGRTIRPAKVGVVKAPDT